MKTSELMMAPLREHPFRAAMALFLGSLTAVFGIALMATSGALIAEAALMPPILELILLIVGVRFFGVGRAAARYAERLMSHDFLFRVLARFRATIFASVAPQATRLAERYHSGDLMRRITGDVDSLQDAYLRVFAPLIVAAVAGVSTVVMIGLVDGRAALSVAVAMIVAAVVTPMLAWRRGRDDGRQIAARKALLQRALTDASRGRQDLQALGYARRAVDDLKTSHQGRLKAIERRQSRRRGIVDALVRGVADLALVAAFVALISPVSSGALAGPMMVLVVLTTAAAFESILLVPAMMDDVSTSRQAARRISALPIGDLRPVGDKPADMQLGDEQQQDGAVGAEEFGEAGPALQVENLKFGYGDESKRDESPIFDDLSFSVAAGEHLAIVGPSGSGKTTLLRLLARQLEPEGGEIRLGAKGLAQWSEQALREVVTVVEQHPHIFETSLRGNLIVAREDADDDALEDALESVGLGPWLAGLPRGLDTYLGEFGAPISGGERRRLSVARAFLRDAPVVLLDEPTAHLDEDTARSVMDALNRLVEGRTAVTITHDLYQPERYDQVLRLKA